MSSLKDSELRYRRLFEAAQDGILILDAETGMIEDVNPYLIKMLGYSREEFIKKKLWEVSAFKDIEASRNAFEALQENETIRYDNLPLKTKDGWLIKVEFIGNVYLVGGEKVIQCNIRDITEHKRAEDALQESEARYRRLFVTAQDGILILDARTGMIEDVNPYLIKMLGYSREEFIKKKLWEVGAFKDIEASKDAFGALQENEYIRYEDLPLKTKDGRLIQVEFVSNVYMVGGIKVIQCDIRDITEHRRIIAALQENEKTYHDLINQSPDGYFIIELSGQILTVNKVMCKELEFSEEEFLSMSIWDIIPEQFLEQYRQRLTKILKGESWKEAEEYEVRGKNGKIFYVEVLSAPRYSGKDIIGFQGIARDITERKRTAEALLQSEERFRKLVEHLPTVVYINPVGDAASTLYVSPQIKTLMGYTPEEWLSDPNFWSKTLYPEDRQRVLTQVARADPSSEPFDMEYRMIARDGRIVWVHDQVALMNDLTGQPQFWQGIMLDITERKQGEEALRAANSYDRRLIEASIDPLVTIGPDGRITDVNEATEIVTGVLRGQLIGDDFSNYFTEPEKARDVYQKVLAEGLVRDYPLTITHTSGKTTDVLYNATVYKNEAGEIQGIFAAARDITERKRAEERIKRQVEHLTALNEIDRMIASSFDLHLSLTSIIDRVISQQKIDAADILIMNPDLNILEFGAGSGFHASGVEKGHPSLGEGYAGRAALERRTIHIADLRMQVDDPPLRKTLASENFVGYFAVPLIAKGKVKGVLEIFHRSPLDPDFEWLDFLNTLAGQASLAIDNATMFGNLQRSNTELALAYDATIEGLSRALDLRDKETEGHSLRVTEIALSLASQFDLRDSDLVQIRWGALLHDIGKMGLPDSILLKPDPLTEQEWVSMKNHPAIAYKLLSPIGFLRSALDIPYCHHEKWDGTGYPRGLRGTQIPLVARIFAVADVWDALTSDRVYRAAWTKEKAREYIRTSSGTHFDPQVVDVFMQVPN